jgi:DNA-directed RNA polymerase specialized sigma24 family protein
MSEANKEQFCFALKSVAQQIEQVEAKASLLRENRAHLMVESRRSGMKYAEIADYLGVTKAYVHQLVSKVLKAEASDS